MAFANVIHYSTYCQVSHYGRPPFVSERNCRTQICKFVMTLD